MSIMCIFHIVAPMRVERIRNFLQLILSQSCLPIPTRSHLLRYVNFVVPERLKLSTYSLEVSCSIQLN